MPDIDEILEILQRNVDATKERMAYLLEEEHLSEVSWTLDHSADDCAARHGER